MCGEADCVEAHWPRASAFPPGLAMSILTWMGATVTAYLEQLDTWWDQALAGLVCESCGMAFRRHSTRDRAAWSDFAHHTEERIPVLRIYCPQCWGTHTLLPDFLTPRQRYQTPVREAVVTGEEPAPPCCAQTSTRWAHQVKANVPRAIQAVTSWLLTEARSLGRQERRCLTGEFRGVNGLRRLRPLVEHAGQSVEASCLFGWINRDFGQRQAFVV